MKLNSLKPISMKLHCMKWRYIVAKAEAYCGETAINHLEPPTHPKELKKTFLKVFALFLFPFFFYLFLLLCMFCYVERRESLSKSQLAAKFSFYVSIFLFSILPETSKGFLRMKRMGHKMDNASTNVKMWILFLHSLYFYSNI